MTTTPPSFRTKSIYLTNRNYRALGIVAKAQETNADALNDLIVTEWLEKHHQPVLAHVDANAEVFQTMQRNTDKFIAEQSEKIKQSNLRPSEVAAEMEEE